MSKNGRVIGKVFDSVIFATSIKIPVDSAILLTPIQPTEIFTQRHKDIDTRKFLATWKLTNERVLKRSC